MKRLLRGPRSHPRREFTPRELDRYPWLRLIVRTVGLAGGVNLEQRFDRTHACVTCGAGSVPVLPLRADLARMGKKDLDRTAHDGFVIVSKRLVDAVAASDLVGFEMRPVEGLSSRFADAGFAWLEPLSEWPPMAPTRMVVRHKPCGTCGRAGHYDSLRKATVFRYSAPPATTGDIAYTWEYFGVWYLAPIERRVGGARQIIVSQRMRSFLRAMKVRWLDFQPVEFDEGTDG